MGHIERAGCQRYSKGWRSAEQDSRPGKSRRIRVVRYIYINQHKCVKHISKIIYNILPQVKVLVAA